MMATEDDRTGSELAELRAELARFVLKEAGAVVAERPDLGLGVALKGAVDAAVRESLEKALRNRRDLDPAAFAERVLRLAEAQGGGPPRAQAAYDAASGGAWGRLLDSLRRRPFAVAIATVILLAAIFAAGWFARDRLAAAPPPAAASSPASTGAPDAADPDAVPAAPSTTPSAASGQPAVLDGVELSRRPGAQIRAAARSRPAAGGRAP